MIYGANGYSGELIAREAYARGERPVLAGRNRARLEALASELQATVRVFALDDAPALQRELSGIEAVLHCAGPFSETSRAMVAACLSTGAHYLDITGEIEVFEAIFALDSEARAARVALLPGVGFDVVPTDCLAANLSHQLPSASELTLAFSTRGGSLSPGTLKTSIQGLGKPGAVRVDGKIVPVPPLFDVREIPFPSGPRMAMTIPWGDVSTAFRTTGIPNIRVYTAVGRRGLRKLRWMTRFAPLIGLRPVNRLLQLAAARKQGPDEAARRRSTIELWGRASTADGREVSETLILPDGYTFTAAAAVSSVQKLLQMSPRPAGAFTPAGLFGSGFLDEVMLRLG